MALWPEGSRLFLLAQGPALTPRPHSPFPPPTWDITMKNMKVRRRGSELLPSCPRQLLGITFPIQLRCPTPSLLEAWNQPLAFSPLANSLGAHTQPPPAFLALPLLTQIGLQAEPAVPLRTLPQPRSLTLRARPLPAGSTAWRCQAKLNCLEPLSQETGSSWGRGSRSYTSLLASQTPPDFTLHGPSLKGSGVKSIYPPATAWPVAYLQPQQVI